MTNIIRPSDIHLDPDKAKRAVMQTALDLGIKCDCRLTTMWRIETDDRKTFIELARESCQSF
jgi:hypothetical protein